MRAMGFLALWIGGTALGACSDGACGELSEICGLCPPTGSGEAARGSCQRTVDTGDEAACQDRIDLGTYAAQGCVPR